MKIQSINPSTGELINEFEETEFEDIEKTIVKARLAQKKWSSKTKNQRINILKNMKEKFIINKKKLIETINKECGFDKEEVEATFYDVIDGFDHYIKNYNEKQNIDFTINQEVFPDTTSNIKFYPHGVIAQMGAWNYPLWQTMITAIPALLTGNSIIYKPSEKSTKTGILINEIINSTEDLPECVFNLVIGKPKVGEYIIKNKVDAVVYTGNIETGKKIIKIAETKPTILELSGNDAAIVCSDCDINQTIDGLVAGAFIHSGEVCDRIKRIYVVEEVSDKIIEGIVKKTESIKDKITPLIRKEALEKVDLQVKKTVQDGGKILIGGGKMKRKGFFYEPTLIKLKNNKAESVKNEIFGPVVSVLVVNSEEEAINLANEGKFGLGTSIWTQNFDKASEIANKCESGIVWINDSNIPLVCGEYFKGWKSTSIPNSMDRLNMFMKSKTIISFNSNKKRDWWF
ncbi:aldehyde dehydrogenase family protein [Candidatus Micrarchaeota archaeon]|nr:aldehyde dehydrogenase family protein [Candidatus Micrarchaeota archaeon]